MKIMSKVRTVVRWSFRLLILLLIILAIAFLVVFRDALYNRFILFPKTGGGMVGHTGGTQQ